MKKSIIWLMTVIMSLTFGALLYFQIMYLERMVKMREAQFTEIVKRSMNLTAGSLERSETLHYIEEEALLMGSSFYDSNQDIGLTNDPQDSARLSSEIDAGVFSMPAPRVLPPSGPTAGIPGRFQELQEILRTQYRYQRGLLDEVILTIMRESGSRPITERADSAVVKKTLRTELANNGLDVPFEFAVTNDKGIIQYASPGYIRDEGNGKVRKDTYTQGMFTLERPTYFLNVTFPTKGDYVFSTVRFVIPTFAFTAILLVVFVYTIILAFRQKKLSEMKNDFINNMTHEFKTPISTISLAAQMLQDDSVKKAPSLLQHISKVITEETKRLRILVERVLVLSMFDNSQVSVKYSEVDANELIANVVQTFKLRVEKNGGTIEFIRGAGSADIYVDGMHFTNVVFTLLDNAVKYRKEDEPLKIVVSTADALSPAGEPVLEVRVSDNGIGIRRDDQKRIFERFYRVSTGNHHDVKGFGIGLAYVRQIMQSFGGMVKVESEPGKGTDFILSVPLVRDSRHDNEIENNNLST